LPDGLATQVGERGLGLSGGERQRIALARALLARPASLILDEPTSALDPAGEARIIETLDRLKRDTTVVTVSHRPSLARAADTVIVLEDGTCVGFGPWAALDPETKALVDALGI
jgi:ABC-type multidrug transport system fused ATPase/permease subunit